MYFKSQLFRISYEFLVADTTDFLTVNGSIISSVLKFSNTCCWGVKIYHARLEIVHATREMFTYNHLQEYDYDQILLDKFIWPLAKNNVLAHDSYCCTKMKPTKPFPLQRKDRLFVGARVIFNSTRTEELGDMEECPPQCRQSNYVSSKWNFC
ncbi:Uncharacterized protein APZ42_012727 [Daphnia magna]|uniref:Uncharacterized protein n=1 Tax=Daphnia magna TaxID=35525 RepID=A0A162RJA9_9CRUS|nr:Uncharacterized protein APZ42_012727 [Daphnia magna]